ncbi:MAG: hypothetical protein V1811_00750 [Candidatus Micrarchaeota archaeon]
MSNRTVKKLLLFALLLAPLAFGNGCSDIVSGQLLQDVQLPVLDQSVSPASDALRVLFYRKLSLEIGPVQNNRLFVLAHDAVEVNQSVGTAGWIYYLAANETAYFRVQKYSDNFTYVCENGDKHQLHASVSFGAPLALEGGKLANVDVVRVTSETPNAFYDSNYSIVSDEFVVVTKDAIDSAGDRIFKGTMFAKQGDVYYYIGSTGRTQTSDVYPSMRYLACCTSSSCTSNFENVLKPSSCSSSLFSKASFCSSENTLVKHACENDACIPEHVDCEFGCLNGACVDGVKPTCKDFYGENIYRRNSVNGVYQNKTPYAFTNACESYNKVRAFSCVGTAPASRVFDCPLGCSEGKCLEAKEAVSTIPSVEPPLEGKPRQQDYSLVVVVLLLIFAGVGVWVLRLPPQKKK